MSYNKKIIAASIALILSACGGGSSTTVNDKAGVEQPSPPVVIETVTLTGQASKGTLVNAQVSVFKYVNNTLVEATANEISADSQLITDVTGNYSVTLINYTGPVKIVISPSQDANTPTTMLCDAPSGCGDVAFGDAVNLTTLSPNFSLSATTNVNKDENIKVNVTPLTHMASALIEDKLNDGGTINQAVIDTNNTIIADIFKIVGDITKLAPTAVENTTAASEEDNVDELRYGLINAGIAEALYNDDSTASIDEKITEMVADLVENEGELLATSANDDDGSFEISIKDVLANAAEAAKKVSENIKADTNLDQVNASELDTKTVELVNETIIVEQSAGDDGRVTPVAKETTDGDSIAKAKALVQDIRVFSHLLGEEQTDGTQHKDHLAIVNNGETFASLIDDSIDMVEAQSDNLTLLQEVIDALSDIGKRSAAVLPLENVSLDDFLLTQGFTGSVSYSKTDYTFSVQAEGNGQTVELDAVLTPAENGLSITLTLSGEVSNADASLIINNGSLATVNFDESITKNDIENDNIQANETIGKLILDVEISQKSTDAVSNPIIFKGALSADLVFIPYISFYQETYYNGNDSDIYQERYTEMFIAPKLLSFNGKFSSLEGDKFEAALTVNVNNAETYTVTGFGNALDDVQKEYKDFQTIDIDPVQNKVTMTQGKYKYEVAFEPGVTATDFALKKTIYTGDDFTEKFWEQIQVSKNYDVESEFQARELIVVFCGTDIEPCRLRFQYLLPNDVYAMDLLEGYTHLNAVPHGFDIDISYAIGQHYFENQELIDDNGNTVNAIELFIAGIGFPSPYQIFNDAVKRQWSNELFFLGWISGWGISPYNNSTRYTDSLFNGLSSLEDAFIFSESIIFLDHKELIHTPQTDEGIVSVNHSFIEDFTTKQTITNDAYLSAPLVEDAFSLNVAEDGSEITVTDSDDGTLVTLTYIKGENDYEYESQEINGDGLFNIERTLTAIEQKNTEHPAYLYQLINHKGKRKLELEGRSGSYVTRYYLLPLDQNNDSVVESYYRIEFFGYLDDAGEFYGLNDILFAANYFPDLPEVLNENLIFSVTESDSENKSYKYFPFLIVDNALSLYKTVGFTDYLLSTNIDGLGRVEQRREKEDFRTALTLGDTISIDGHLIGFPEGTTESPLETDSNYFDVSAAINIAVSFGEYDVDISLAGKRSNFNSGDFDLSMAYQLPDSETKRTFTLSISSALDENETINEPNVLLLTNSEGMTVEFTDFPDTNLEDNQRVIGKVWYQENTDAEKILAGVVVMRNDNALIIYDDGTIESL